ncbi:MAG TPA: AraC family transcriptional regulator [Usitatibacter sp.]|jgi:AraC family transcriptional regulator|nr:AraC family transcriptional regulator [Usitatibacter sp.]
MGPLDRRRGISARQLQQVLECMELRLGQPLRIYHLAEELRMSPFHFSRLFKRTTGQSPHRFVTLHRLEKAKELLASSEMPIVAVACAVGYLTQAHFTTAFGRHVGITPKAYRMSRRVERRSSPPDERA